jgi:polyhydroxybutyrate depolymerase
VRSGGRRRVALVHVPRGAWRGSPLVLALHGAHADGAFMQSYSGLSRVADRSGFVVAYPSALGRPAFWDLTGPGDVAFVRRLIDRLWRTGCVSTRRTYAVGVSNGGGMTARLGCELSSRLAGIVVVAGGFRSLPPCAPDRPVSVLEIHGTADRVVPYAGRSDDGFAGAVRAWVEGWVGRDGCPPQPRERRMTPRVERLDWGPCAQGTAVEHLVIQGGEHAWPGATPPDRGPSAGISAAAQAWRFLQSRRLARPSAS